MRKGSRGEEEVCATYPIFFGGSLKSQHIRRRSQPHVRELDADLELVTGY